MMCCAFVVTFDVASFPLLANSLEATIIRDNPISSLLRYLLFPTEELKVHNYTWGTFRGVSDESLDDKREDDHIVAAFSDAKSLKPHYYRGGITANQSRHWSATDPASYCDDGHLLFPSILSRPGITFISQYFWIDKLRMKTTPLIIGDINHWRTDVTNYSISADVENDIVKVNETLFPDEYELNDEGEVGAHVMNDRESLVEISGYLQNEDFDCMSLSPTACLDQFIETTPFDLYTKWLKLYNERPKHVELCRRIVSKLMICVQCRKTADIHMVAADADTCAQCSQWFRNICTVKNG